MVDLDRRLAAESRPVTELPLCDVRLYDDRRHPWAVLVPRRTGAVELFDLAPEDRVQLTEEIALVGAALKAMTGAVKINIGALGNVVRQLHVHVVARFETDAAWPGPVWGRGAREPYDDWAPVARALADAIASRPGGRPGGRVGPPG